MLHLLLKMECFLYVFSTNFTGLMPVSGYYDVLNADNVTIKKWCSSY